jgi:hypothetical protein
MPQPPTASRKARSAVCQARRCTTFGARYDPCITGALHRASSWINAKRTEEGQRGVQGRGFLELRERVHLFSEVNRQDRSGTWRRPQHNGPRTKGGFVGGSEDDCVCAGGASLGGGLCFRRCQRWSQGACFDPPPPWLPATPLSTWPGGAQKEKNHREGGFQFRLFVEHHHGLTG